MAPKRTIGGLRQYRRNEIARSPQNNQELKVIYFHRCILEQLSQPGYEYVSDRANVLQFFPILCRDNIDPTQVNYDQTSQQGFYGFFETCDRYDSVKPLSLKVETRCLQSSGPVAADYPDQPTQRSLPAAALQTHARAIVDYEPDDLSGVTFVENDKFLNAASCSSTYVGGTFKTIADFPLKQIRVPVPLNASSQQYVDSSLQNEPVFFPTDVFRGPTSARPVEDQPRFGGLYWTHSNMSAAAAGYAAEIPSGGPPPRLYTQTILTLKCVFRGNKEYINTAP